MAYHLDINLYTKKLYSFVNQCRPEKGVVFQDTQVSNTILVNNIGILHCFKQLLCINLGIYARCAQKTGKEERKILIDSFSITT